MPITCSILNRLKSKKFNKFRPNFRVNLNNQNFMIGITELKARNHEKYKFIQIIIIHKRRKITNCV